ncbi:MAG: hypothetical protein J7L76_03195 [Spirochaetaceae bacterium]|nr:hypothetical protein [Spirochaetaceae bacterium]
MKKRTALCLIFIVLLTALCHPAIADVYFPHVASNGIWETEICVINTGAATLSGTFKAYNNSGTSLSGNIAVTLTAKARRQINVGDNFIDPEAIGYIIFNTDSDNVVGYTKFYIDGQYRVAVPAISDITTGDLYISHIASSSTWWTGVSIVNTTSAAKTLTIEFDDGTTNTVQLAANEHKAFTIKSLFAGTPQPGLNSAVIKNADGVIGLELFGSGNQLSGILLNNDTAVNMYYPHIATTGTWWIGIVAYNPSATSCTLTIKPYSANGTALATCTVLVAGQKKYIASVADLGLPAASAWFAIESTSAITGFELFGTGDGKLLAGYTAVNISNTEGVFAKLEKDGWTGIAFVNITGNPAGVELAAINDVGTVIATEYITLNPYQKMVDIPKNIFTGDISNATYIAYSSCQALVGFQLNSSSDNMMLDGLPGMFVGGGGSSSGSVLTMSSSEAVPGSFITIEDDSIKEGEALNVTFADTSGYHVTLKTILTENGSARVPVPPVVDLSTGEFTSSEVIVTIPSCAQVMLHILPLPDLPDVNPGDVVKMYLAYTKSNLQTVLDHMDQFSSEFDYDTSGLKQQIQNQINTIDTSINEIETSAQMSMYSFYDESIALDQNDLGIFDQLLFAVLKGAMEEDLNGPVKGNIVAVAVNMLSHEDENVPLEELENWVNSTVKDSKILLVGGSVFVTVAGVCMAPDVATGTTTTLYKLQATGASIMVVGTASEGLAAIRTFIDKNDLDPNQVYILGNEYQNKGIGGIKNMAIAAGSEVNSVVNLWSFFNAYYNVREAVSNLICNADPVPSSFEDYCEEWEDRHESPEVAIKLLKFYNEIMCPGVEGELVFWLDGDGAEKVNVEIDWGDGDGETLNLQPGGYYSGMKHAFSLGAEDSRLFTIRVNAHDGQGNDAWEQVVVLVKKAGGPDPPPIIPPENRCENLSGELEVKVLIGPAEAVGLEPFAVGSIPFSTTSESPPYTIQGSGTLSYEDTLEAEWGTYSVTFDMDVEISGECLPDENTLNIILNASGEQYIYVQADDFSFDDLWEGTFETPMSFTLNEGATFEGEGYTFVLHINQ